MYLFAFDFFRVTLLVFFSFRPLASVYSRITP